MGFWEPILGLSRAWKSAQKGEILKGSPISKSQDIFGRNFGNFSPILTKLAPDDPWGELWGLATLDCWFSRTVGRNHPKCTKTLVFIWLGWNLVGRSIFAFHEDCRFSRFLTPQGGTVGRNPPKCTKKFINSLETFPNTHFSIFHGIENKLSQLVVITFLFPHLMCMCNFEHMRSEVLLVCYSGCKSMHTLCCQNGIFSPLFNGVVHNLFDVATELTCLLESS